MSSAARAFHPGRLIGRVRVPGSKSVTNRALVLAALAPGESVLINPLDADDTRALARALEALGARIAFGEGEWTVTGPLAPDVDREITIDIGPAGTPARFLTALLAALPGRFVLDGSARMRERPMGPLIAALRSLGARIEPLGSEDRLPLRITGGVLRGGSVKIRGDVSSQFLSALMLIARLTPEPIVLEIEGPVSSASYLAVTRRTLEPFSAAEGGYRCARFVVPGDDSAACFAIAGAIVSDGHVELEGLDPFSEQPDALFREWAQRAGGRLTWSWEGDNGALLSVTGPLNAGPLSGLDVDVDPAPDAALPLVALLAFANGTSRLTGVERLADKESDRLAAALELLTLSGCACAREHDASGRTCLVIGPDPGEMKRADWLAHDDHRVAMAAAVLALGLPPGSTLDTPHVVSKSYPAFFSDWERLLKAR
ncbi:MAG: 3-phosphoshikimate 1-carboxyvinyltransferase [Thermoanaerobaculia bacterium]